MKALNVCLAIGGFLILVCTGLIVPVVYLAFGWVGFLATVLPEVHFNGAAFVQAGVVLFIVVLLAHYLLGWAYAGTGGTISIVLVAFLG